MDCTHLLWLVVEVYLPCPEKYECDGVSSSVGMMTFPTEWKNEKCSKPPTSTCVILCYLVIQYSLAAGEACLGGNPI